MATSRRRAFEHQDPTKGNFRAYKNLAPTSADQPRRPAFTGRISVPGNTEERAFTLWSAASKSTGNLILSGPVTPTRAQQWAELSRKEGEPSPDVEKFVTMKDGDKPFPVKPHHLVLFTAPPKDVEEGKKAPPKMFGYYNPGGDEPVVVISAFEHADRNNNIMLLGPVDVYDPNKSYDQQLAHAPDDEMDDRKPEIPHHLLPEKPNGRARTADEGPGR